MMHILISTIKNMRIIIVYSYEYYFSKIFNIYSFYWYIKSTINVKSKLFILFFYNIYSLQPAI